MKIIFLDIDGVLASYLNMRRIDKNGPSFIKGAVESLNILIELSGADVCISSAWRVGKSTAQLQEILNARGVKCNVVGKTKPSTGNSSRGDEIKDWLDSHTEYNEYIIIDDEMTDIIGTIPYNWKTHIVTNPYRCLDMYDVARLYREVWPKLEVYKNRITLEESQRLKRDK